MSQSKITKKLEQLEKLFDQIDEARVINSDDSETWDSDALYNLVENLKDALKLLEDQKVQGKFEEGLCSLVDDYNSAKEEEDF